MNSSLGRSSRPVADRPNSTRYIAMSPATSAHSVAVTCAARRSSRTIVRGRPDALRCDSFGEVDAYAHTRPEVGLRSAQIDRNRIVLIAAGRRLRLERNCANPAGELAPIERLDLQ